MAEIYQPSQQEALRQRIDDMFDASDIAIHSLLTRILNRVRAPEAPQNGLDSSPDTTTSLSGDASPEGSDELEPR